MSVVVGYKKDNKVFLGCDSQVTRGGTRKTLTSPNNYKIWKVKGVENCIIGHVGYLRDANVIRIMDNLIPELVELHDLVDFEYVVSEIVPKMVKELVYYGYYKEECPLEGIDSRFLIAYKDKLFYINTDLSVVEIDDMIAIGSGESEAIGSMLSTEGLDPRERIIRSIKATAAHDLYVDYPIIISNTEDCKFETIFEDK